MHVGHGFEAAVRMIREAADVVFRIIGAERIEHQERVQPALQRLRQHACQLHAVTVGSGLAGHQLLDFARARHSLVPQSREG
jgi:EAL domain-containing protein (putative c-di-GMP-specific phosphodiesterase class I)